MKAEMMGRSGMLSFFGRLLKPYRMWVLLALGASFAASAAGVALMMLGAWILGKAAFMVSVAEIQTAVVGVRFFGISRSLFRYLERLIGHKVSFSFMIELRDALYRAGVADFPQNFGTTHSGDELHKYIEDSAAAERLFISYFLPILAAAAVSAVFLIVSFLGHPLYFLAACVYFSVSLVIMPVILYRLNRRDAERLRNFEIMSSGTAVDIATAGPDLDRLEQKGRISGVYLARAAVILDLKGLTANRESYVQSIQSLLSMLTVGCLSYAVIISSPGRFGDPLFFVSLVLGIMALQEVILPVNIAALWLGRESRSVMNIVSRTGTELHKEDQVEKKRVMIDCLRPETVRIESLNYIPPGGSVPLLQGLQAEFRAGERILITGKSGSGKSSLAYLLLGLIHGEGAVYFDDIPLEDLAVSLLRRTVGYMPQQNIFFNDTLMNNLCPQGDPPGDAEILALLEKFGLLRLPLIREYGLHRPFNPLTSGLSGGELQRLGFIRTLLTDAPVMIFDEVGSSLDSDAAAKIFETITDDTKHDIRIVISHMPMLLEKFTRIYRIEGGKLVEQVRPRSDLGRTCLLN